MGVPALLLAFLVLFAVAWRFWSRSQNSWIPILDYSKFLSANPQQRHEFLLSLKDACHRVGFFYVINHGISRKLQGKIVNQSRQFFSLPLEEKCLVENTHSQQFRGYTRVGSEYTKGKIDYREQIEFGHDKKARELGPKDPKYLRLIGPNLYPDLPGFKETVDTYFEQVSNLADSLLQALALSLEVPADTFKKDFTDPYVIMKLINYPPQTEDGHIGVGSHRDYGYLTLTMQDEVGGLQVQLNNGKWIDAHPIPDSYVVNLGEMLQLVTNNFYRSTVHRVKTIKSKGGRISIPHFYNPNLHTEIAPLKLKDKYRRVDFETMKPMIFGINMLKGHTRTHKKVTEKFYSDLQPEDISNPS